MLIFIRGDSILTPEYISTLRDAAEKIAEPISDYLIRDIARRISQAGQLTSTAAYQIWIAQNQGLSQKEIKKRLEKLLKKSNDEIEKLLTQSAEVGYNFDLTHLPTAAAIPFEENESLQQIVSAAVKLAQDDFTNIVQTIGFVAPDGKTYPLTKAYKKACDFAFNQVVTGAADYNTAIRRACKNLANQGLRTIDYESGVHTSLEAAVRRNIMGGLGLMQEQISEENHDKFGANGWEISAHAASAPDHEPIQGKQYSDEEYKALNNSLVRRIGTLNCGHSAFPIILGVSEPTYTDEQLEEFKRQNAEGVTYQGKHYTTYEATQKQRQIERAIRTQKRRVLTAEATGDEERLLTSQVKYRRLNEEYERFSKGVGLRTQTERMYVEGFTPKHGKAAAKAAKNVDNNTKSDIINTKVSGDTVTNPMDAKRYQKMKAGLANNGITVMQATGDDLRYLKFGLGAEASYSSGYIMHIGETPSASAMFEESIHATQARVYGEIENSDPKELCAREVAANRKLWKHRKAYGFTRDDENDISKNLALWEEKFEKVVGMSYDESSYRREV